MASEVTSQADAGSPDWWLTLLTRGLLDRLPYLDERAAYVEGRQAFPQLDRRYWKAYGHLQSICSTNYCGLVTNAAVQRMEIRGFEFGEGGVLDPEAASIWSANDMDMQSTTINAHAAKFGLAYGLVEPPDPDDDSNPNQLPVITALDPRTCIIYRDPKKPTRALAALRLWNDDVFGRVLAVLYLPDAIYGYLGPEIANLSGIPMVELQNRLLGVNGGPGGFQLAETVDNELGQVPIVEFVWRPETGLLPESEAGFDVRTIQDRLNQTVFDRVSISSSQAYKQRWVSGIKPATNKQGNAKAPFDPGSDKLWVTESVDAKFGEFTSADVSQILDAIRDDVSDIAAITQTPSHYLMGKVANVSGETLALAETGLVKKIKQRMKSMGWSYEVLMRLAFAYSGDSRATDPAACVIWIDPEQNALTDQAAAAAQFISSGIPVNITMERVGGFTEDQITAAQEQAEIQQQQQLEMQSQQMEMNAQVAQAGIGESQAKAQALKAGPSTTGNGGGNPRASKATTSKASKATGKPASPTKPTSA